MGQSKQAKRAFYEAHPFCCFCGGLTKAETIDHQPARVFFKGRQWPEGFAFPACDQCNQVSKGAKRVLAMLIHGEGEETDGKYAAHVASLEREFPGLVKSMLPDSTREIRNILKKKNLNRPGGVSFSEVPLVKLKTDFWQPHIELFSRKIMLALHYQCFKVPLSSSGRLWFFNNTNVDFMAGDFPSEMLAMMGNLARPTRQNRFLDDQFLVRWGFSDQGPTGIFSAQFQGKFTVSGITATQPDIFIDSWIDKTYRPFDWSS